MSSAVGQIIAIMSGGALGALSRFAVAQLAIGLLGKGFPYGTLIVNVFGSLLMGFLSIYFLTKTNLDPMLRMAILVGFLGSFTTFSTFSMDTLILLESGAVAKGLLNIAANVCLSLLALWVGMIIARSVFTP